MLELFTFRISHFSEKSRWMLDASGTEYREVRWTPFFHIVPALRHGRRGTTVPILRHRGGYVQDSTRILHWLDANMPGFHLLPRDASLRREVLEIEEQLDRVGGHVTRYLYSATMDDAQAVTRLWSFDAGPLQRRFISTAFPLLRAAFRNKLKLSAQHVARSRQAISEAFDFLDARLADGREHLVGDTLTAADITACALLAPLIGPDEHELYSRDDLRESIAPLVGEWLQRPAAQWVRARYRERHA